MLFSTVAAPGVPQTSSISMSSPIVGIFHFGGKYLKVEYLKVGMLGTEFILSMSLEKDIRPEAVLMHCLAASPLHKPLLCHPLTGRRHQGWRHPPGDWPLPLSQRGERERGQAHLDFGYEFPHTSTPAMFSVRMKLPFHLPQDTLPENREDEEHYMLTVCPSEVCQDLPSPSFPWLWKTVT